MPEEIQRIVNEYNEFVDDVGYDAKITVGLNLDAIEEFVVGALWPKGTLEAKIPAVRATGKTFDEVLDSLKRGWEEAKQAYRQQRIRTMAFLIMNLTESKGSCTVEDLSVMAQFSEAEIREYGQLAVIDANMLSTKGPFNIT